MRRNLRRRGWIELAAAALTAIVTVVTLISREWIEVVFGVDPDNHSGALEWLIVVVLSVITATLLVMAAQEWRTAGVETRKKN